MIALLQTNKKAAESKMYFPFSPPDAKNKWKTTSNQINTTSHQETTMTIVFLILPHTERTLRMRHMPQNKFWNDLHSIVCENRTLIFHIVLYRFNIFTSFSSVPIYPHNCSVSFRHILIVALYRSGTFSSSLCLLFYLVSFCTYTYTIFHSHIFVRFSIHFIKKEKYLWNATNVFGQFYLPLY